MPAQILGSINLISPVEGDLRYIRRDTSSTVEAGVIITFLDAGANVRIKNGKLQFKNDTTGLYHNLNMRNDPQGIPETYITDLGET